MDTSGPVRAKTYEEIESDLKAYSSLTLAQGQIRINPGMKRAIKAMVQWARDIYRTDLDPNTVAIPVFNNAPTIRRYKTNLNFVKSCLR